MFASYAQHICIITSTKQEMFSPQSIYWLVWLHEDYWEDLYETLMADESQPRTDCVNVGADPDEGMDPGTGSYTL